MRIVTALDSLKGSLPAEEATQAVARGLRRALPGSSVIVHPMADGGEGTAAVLFRGRPRAWVPVPTVDALGRPSPAGYFRDGDEAVLDLATASGLVLVQDAVDALAASTAGTGRVIRRALEAGARSILLGLGGSASTDGGVGLLSELGVVFRDAAGAPLRPGGGALSELAHIDVSGLLPAARRARWTLLCDVTNPLVGPLGAAHTFGPQKGASRTDVVRLELGLDVLGSFLVRGGGPPDVHVRAGAGAAGGTAAALMSLLGAQLVPGADHVADAVGLLADLPGSDLVVTGEGSVDAQSLDGKVVGTVTRFAQRAGVPVLVLAGRVDLSCADRDRLGAAAVLSIAPGAATLAHLSEEAAELLERTAAEVASLVGALRPPAARADQPQPFTPPPSRPHRVIGRPAHLSNAPSTSQEKP